MSLSRKIADAVEAAGAPPCPIEAEARSAPPRPPIDRFRPRRPRLRRPRLRRHSTRWTCRPRSLRAWGDRLAARVTYLMEPLVVQEVDAEAGQAELRSQSPTPRADRRSFYEVRLRREGVAPTSAASPSTTPPAAEAPSPAR